MLLRAFHIAACVLAAGAVAACGGGDDSGTTSAEKRPPTAVPQVTRGPAAATARRRVSTRSTRFVRRWNALCRTLPAPPTISETGSARERAREALRDRQRLRDLLKGLRRLGRPPDRMRDVVRDYRRATRDQLYLDGRVHRAAAPAHGEVDRQALAVGLKHNRFNVQRRAKVVRSLRLSSRCR